MPTYNPLLISCEEVPKRRTKRRVRSSLQKSSRLHMLTARLAQFRTVMALRTLRSIVQKTLPAPATHVARKSFLHRKTFLRAATTPHVWRTSLSAHRDPRRTSIVRSSVRESGCCRPEKPEPARRARGGPRRPRRGGAGGPGA